MHRHHAQVDSIGIKLIVSYDGSNFAGWQVQPGQRTIQNELEHAVSRIAGHRVRVRVAGRTDAGVHAIGQIAAFDTQRDLPMRNWVLALNSNLPPDIAVRSADKCIVGYEPRHDAIEKTYRYLLHLGIVRSPLLRNRVWHLGKLVEREFPSATSLHGSIHKLDIESMQKAANLFIGTHNFGAFRASDDEHKTTNRTIHNISFFNPYYDSPDLLAIEIRGTAFLKHMVRIMVGTLIDVGRGRLDKSSIQTLLTAESERCKAGETAPAHGLTLVSVKLGRKSKET